MQKTPPATFFESLATKSFAGYKNKSAIVIARDEEGNIKTDAASIATFDKFAADHPAFFENIELAAAAPDISIETPTPGEDGIALNVHGILQIMEWQAQSLIGKQDPQGACDVAIQALRLAKQVEEPFVIDSLLGLAFRSVASNTMFKIMDTGMLPDVAPDTLNEVYSLLDELSEEHVLVDSYVSAIKNERSSSIYHIVDSNVGEHYEMDQSRIARLTSKIPGGPAMVTGNTYLDQMEEVLEICTSPLSTKFNLDETTDDWNTLVLFGGDITPVFIHLRDKFGEATALLRVVRILMALNSAADAAERDAWPTEYLERLGVPAASTIDPYSGKPMTIKRVDGNWLVYSYGPNQSDDGGEYPLDQTYQSQNNIED